jgi:hypothetical protein
MNRSEDPMNRSEQERTRIVRAWLDEGSTELSAHVRDAVVRGVRASTQDRPFSWRFSDMNAQAKLAILAAAVLVVAVAGINLLRVDENVGGPTVAPSHDPLTPNPQPSAVTTGDFPSGLLTPDIPYAMTRDTVPFSVVFPTSGWWSNGDFYIENAAKAAELFFWPSAPDGVFVDPCSATQGPPLSSNAELANAVASIPGIALVSGPTDVTVGGLPAKHIVLTVPDDIACAVGDFKLWYAEGIDGGRYASRLGNTIRVWIIDAGDGTRLWIDAETPADASAESEAEIQQVIDSIDFPLGIAPAAGDLQPGAYSMGIGLGLSFELETSGWVSGPRNADGSVGPISRGTGSPDGAVIRFVGDPIRRVFTDPCAHTLGPEIGPTRFDLAAAMASIPGVDVTGPTSQSLAQGNSNAEHLVLTIPDDIECPPTDFYLWSDEGVGTRAATALRSTIRVWIFHPNNRMGGICCGRVVIEAETYAGASPELEREIQRIIDSVWHGG